MRTAAIIVLVLLILLLALPLGMAMGCPLHASTCSTTLGVCAAILGFVSLLASAMTLLIPKRSSALHTFLLVRSLDRPPRFL